MPSEHEGLDVKTERADRPHPCCTVPTPWRRAGPTSSGPRERRASAGSARSSSSSRCSTATSGTATSTDNPLQDARRSAPRRSSSPRSLLILVMIALMMALPLINGRSPHRSCIRSRSRSGSPRSEGSTARSTRCVRTLDVFLGYATFRDELGGNPRRGHPVRRPAGHGQDLPGQGDGQAGGRAVPVHLGAGVPVDVVRDDGNARSARSSRRCARLARKEGGAIGFIEEIDAIGGRATAA